MTPRKKKAEKVEETALVPAKPADKLGLQVRGPNGLMLVQTQWLEKLLETGSWRKACAALDPPITVRRVRDWITEDLDFEVALDRLLRPDLEGTKKELDTLASEAPGVYDDALTAERGLRVKATCPECGTEFTVNTMRPDWRTRLKAADTLLRARKLLIDSKEIGVKGNVTHTHLTGDEHMALLAWKAGKEVPEAVMAKLREKGFIT